MTDWKPNLRRLDSITDVPYCVDQRRITDFFSEPADEYFDQLGIILMGVFPNALAQLRAREDTATVFP